MILDVSFVGSFAEYRWLACVAVYSANLNWSIALVCKVRSESGRSRLSLYDLNWLVVRSVSGAILLSESGFVFQS